MVERLLSTHLLDEVRAILGTSDRVQLKTNRLIQFNAQGHRWMRLLEKAYPIKRINRPHSTLVFGVQKSGTTVVAKALAHCAKKSLTADHPALWPILDEPVERRQQFVNSVLAKHPFTLSNDFVKEPCMTIAPELFHPLFSGTSVLVIRNPLNTIRSILDRLKIDPSSQTLDLASIHPNWQRVFKCDANVPPFIQLAHYWNECMDRSIWHSEGIFQIHYETFLVDPDQQIETTLRHLGMTMKTSSKSILSQQYQSKGANRNVPIEELVHPDILSVADQLTKPVYEKFKQA